MILCFNNQIIDNLWNYDHRHGANHNNHKNKTLHLTNLVYHIICNSKLDPTIGLIAKTTIQIASIQYHVLHIAISMSR